MYIILIEGLGYMLLEIVFRTTQDTAAKDNWQLTTIQLQKRESHIICTIGPFYTCGIVVSTNSTPWRNTLGDFNKFTLEKNDKKKKNQSELGGNIHETRLYF